MILAGLPLRSVIPAIQPTSCLARARAPFRRAPVCFTILLRAQLLCLSRGDARARARGAREKGGRARRTDFYEVSKERPPAAADAAALSRSLIDNVFIARVLSCNFGPGGPA